MGKNKEKQTQITYEEERIVDSGDMLTKSSNQAKSKVVEFDKMSKKTSNKMVAAPIERSLPKNEDKPPIDISINETPVSDDVNLLANETPLEMVQNIPTQSEQAPIYSDVQMNGGITLHATTRGVEDFAKKQKKRSCVMVGGIITTLLLLCASLVLMIKLEIIKIPKKIDTIYNQYSYNYTNEDIKCRYDKQVELYWNENDDIITIYGENKDNFLKISTSDIDANDLIDNFDDLKEVEEIKETNNGLYSTLVQYSLDKNTNVYTKVLDKGKKHIVVVFVVGDNDNKKEIETLKTIFDTAIFTE